MHIGYLSLAYKLGKMSVQMETEKEEEMMETEVGACNPPASSFP